MENKYPTKKDIEEHTRQLVASIRQYLRGYDKNADFVKNGLRVLFTDLVLEADNNSFIPNEVEINFNKFLNNLK